MKKVFAVLTALLLCGGLLAGCGPAAGGGEGTYKIGIIQFVAHEALDSAYKGFVDGLAEAGYKDGEKITLDYQNAQGEMSNCPIIASKLANGNCDLVLAIATPAAQAMATATKEKQDVPVLITAVTDAVSTGLVASNEKPGGNITGTSDMGPIAKQIELLKKLVPTAKKIGFLYNSSEANSVLQIEMARAVAQEMGLETEDFTVSQTNDVQAVAKSMAGKVDAAYSPTDNMIAQTMSTVSKACIEAKIPLVVGEVGMVENGGLASYSVDYYELGKITAQQAVAILEGKSKPADMPIRYQEEFSLAVNQETAQALGIAIPSDL